MVVAGSLRELYPQWWGAKGDGKADDTAATIAALSSSNSTPVIRFNPGTYLLTSKVSIPDGKTGTGPGVLLLSDNSQLTLGNHSALKDCVVRGILTGPHARTSDVAGVITTNTTAASVTGCKISDLTRAGVEADASADTVIVNNEISHIESVVSASHSGLDFLFSGTAGIWVYGVGGAPVCASQNMITGNNIHDVSAAAGIYQVTIGINVVKSRCNSLIQGNRIRNITSDQAEAIGIEAFDNSADVPDTSHTIANNDIQTVRGGRFESTNHLSYYITVAICRGCVVASNRILTDQGLPAGGVLGIETANDYGVTVQGNKIKNVIGSALGQLSINDTLNSTFSGNTLLNLDPSKSYLGIYTIGGGTHENLEKVNDTMNASRRNVISGNILTGAFIYVSQYTFDTTVDKNRCNQTLSRPGLTCLTWASGSGSITNNIFVSANSTPGPQNAAIYILSMAEYPAMGLVISGNELTSPLGIGVEGRTAAATVDINHNSFSASSGGQAVYQAGKIESSSLTFNTIRTSLFYQYTGRFFPSPATRVTSSNAWDDLSSYLAGDPALRLI